MLLFSAAEILEDSYQRYHNLREVALSVYAPKIEEYYDSPDFEHLCDIIVFQFDDHNQKQIAQRLGVPHQRLLYDLIKLATGARLFKQGK